MKQQICKAKVHEQIPNSIKHRKLPEEHNERAKATNFTFVDHVLVADDFTKYFGRIVEARAKTKTVEK